MNKIDVYKKCKFISKGNYFIKNCNCKLLFDKKIIIEENSVFGDDFGLFQGYTDESNIIIYHTPYKSEEYCYFDDFLIYDDYNNEISKLTLREYLNLIRKQKFNKINGKNI